MAEAVASSPNLETPRSWRQWVGQWAPRWPERRGSGVRLAMALGALALASGIATFWALTPGGIPLGDATTVRVLLLLDLVLLLLLGAVVARQLVRLWMERRRGSAGSRLHTRMVALFSLVAIIPAIVMAVFSLLFFNLGVQAWFSNRVTTAVDASVAVAEAYITEHRKVVQSEILAMAADLNREAPRLSRNPALFNQIVSTQARLRALPEAIVFDGTGRVLARSGLSLLMEFERMPVSAMKTADAGEVVLIDSENDDRVRALVRLDRFVDAYLYVGRFVDPRVIDHLERTRDAAAQYRRLDAARSGLELTFAALFIVVALLVLLAAIGFGLAIATRLVTPIGGLVAAAERVRQGDFSVHVAEGVNDDEMGILGRAFNRMTDQLAVQRAELVEANRQLDARRRFSEAVLGGVSAGVIGIGRDGRVTLPNRSATELLSIPEEQLIDRPLAEAAPELAPLFEEVAKGSARQAERQIILRRDGATRTLLARIVRETSGGDTVGYVLTFDDVTDLLNAQRTAAWADVARRIAHEIRNPLTPIQLSAERLRRKYMKEVTSDPEAFAKCTDTIIRQVGDIGRMVDEFSAFARMPRPVFRRENVVDAVRQALFAQQMGHGEIDYVTKFAAAPVELRCDGRQLGQALNNVLLNAAQALETPAAAAGGAPVRGRIEVRVENEADSGLSIAVIDNGPGLPREERERLTEPYVTTREKGTGLGLAIVKKIMEEHGGSLVLGDAPPDARAASPEGSGVGACVILRFPAALRAGTDDDTPALAAEGHLAMGVAHGA
jgi:two-component system, NtrC family, nitrogen regulation sensor histidine kinase NtrY